MLCSVLPVDASCTCIHVRVHDVVCMYVVQFIIQLHIHVHQNMCSLALDALKQFLTLTKSEILLKTLDLYSAWSLLEKEDTFPHGILHVAR